jgi:Secretion system C-terminal sorting domain
VSGCHLKDAVEEKATASVGLSTYPNPTTNYLNFYAHAPSHASTATFRIIEAKGCLVKEFKTDNLASTFIVPVWDWHAGAYWLQYCAGSEAVISTQFQILK